MWRKCILMSVAIFTPFMFITGQTTKTGRTKKAIICLTYDDGLETQLSMAIPQLNTAGFKATFFLNSIQGSSQSDIIGQTPEAVMGWSNAAKNGHELANHTLFHPCPQKLGWDRSVAIDNYTLEKIISEIRIQNDLLSQLDPKRMVRSFAFPCNNVFIGDTDYSKMIRNKGLVTFGRTGGDSNSVIIDYGHLNAMQVPSWHVWTGTTGTELIAFAQKVKNAGGMGIYQFHGVGGQIFQVSAEAHQALLDYLKANADGYWVTTFSEAMEFITAQRK